MRRYDEQRCEIDEDGDIVCEPVEEDFSEEDAAPKVLPDAPRVENGVRPSRDDVERLV